MIENQTLFLRKNSRLYKKSHPWEVASLSLFHLRGIKCCKYSK